MSTSADQAKSDNIQRVREQASAARARQAASARRGKAAKSLGIVLGAALVLTGIIALAVFGPQWFGNDSKAQVEVSGTTGVVNSSGERVQAQIVAKADEPFIAVGDENAPATIDYWFDFSCPHCRDYHTAVGPAMADAIASGQLKVNFRTVQVVHPFGRLAGAALLSVAKHQPERYFDVMEGLYDIEMQPQTQFTMEDYATAVQGMGITDEATLNSIRSGEFTGTVDKNTKDALANGLKGTPAVAVDGTFLDELPDQAALAKIITDHGGDASKVPALQNQQA